MNTEERAAYYEQHKDDEDLWGDAVEAPEPQTRRALRATVTVRLTTEESTLVREQAKRRGQTYSEVIRTAIHQAYQPQLNIKQGGSVDLIYNSPPPPDYLPTVVVDPTLQTPRYATSNAGYEEQRVA